MTDRLRCHDEAALFKKQNPCLIKQTRVFISTASSV